MKLLVDAKANPNVPDRDEKTPLHSAARHGCGIAIEMLLTAGSDKDSFDLEGNTPLMHVVQHCEGQDVIKHARVLLKAGAMPDVRNVHGECPSSIHFKLSMLGGLGNPPDDVLSRDLQDKLTKLLEPHLRRVHNRLAFAMAGHPRLGAASDARVLDPELVALVWSFAERQEEEEGASALRSRACPCHIALAAAPPSLFDADGVALPRACLCSASLRRP